MLINNSGALIEDASQENQVNFEKLESEYKTKVLKKYNAYNGNSSLIKAKKQEYQSLKFQIQTHLENNLTLENEGKVKAHYTEIITEYKHQIKTKEHTLECYNNMFARLYKTNYLISRRNDDEMKQEQLREFQLDQYKNIQTNAIKTLKSKKAMLAKITELNDMENLNQQSQVKQKNHIAIQLKARVNILLNNITNEELELNTVKAKQEIVTNRTKELIPLNAKVCSEIILNRKDYFRTRIILYGICREMKVRNYTEMINSYNAKKFKEQKQLTEFNILNNHIRKYSAEYYDLVEESKLLNKKIEDKKKYESLLNDKIEKTKDRLATLASYRVLQIQSISKIKTVLISILSYMIKYFNRICKLTNHPLMNVNKAKVLLQENHIGTCLNFFITFAKTIYNINSTTLHKVIESYFAFKSSGRDDSVVDEEIYEVMVYSNAEFIIGYNDYYQKISEQYHRMLEIINQSIKNHNKEKRASNDYFPPNQFPLVRRADKKRSNILQLSNISPSEQIEEIKKLFYSKKGNRNGNKSHLFPEFSFDTKNDDDMFNDNNNTNSKRCFSTKSKCSSYSFGNEKELYIHRLNDIRRLKLQYFNAKEKSPVETQNINEFYHRLKKRFKKNQELKKAQKEKKSVSTPSKNQIKATSPGHHDTSPSPNANINVNPNKQRSNTNANINVDLEGSFKLYITQPSLPLVSSPKHVHFGPKVVDVEFYDPKRNKHSFNYFQKSVTMSFPLYSQRGRKSHLLTYSQM